MDMRDSYLSFFSKCNISKDQLFEFGLSDTIYVDEKIACYAWECLKDKIINNGSVHIRDFGRNAAGTHLLKSFYLHVFKNENVQADATNNVEPTKLIRKWTGFSKSGGNNYQVIRNYQISHVFGRTKNPYCFTAPWNIVYIPKIIDPFTGHEAKGDFVNEFTQMFQKQCYLRFKLLIDDFNEIVTSPDFRKKLEDAIKRMEFDEKVDKRDIDRLRVSIKNEFSPIPKFD
jgi:hypothetical protein